MANENDTGSIAADVGSDTEVKTPMVKKQSSFRRQKTTAEPVQAASKATAVKSQAAKPRKYSEQEKIEKLKTIETDISEGTSTLKDAIKNAGISEQTYYNWKQAAKPVEKSDEKPVPAGDALADLVQLEEENRRLRKLLAEKLRSENAELRKRLGLD
jgi:putative transposase